MTLEPKRKGELRSLTFEQIPEVAFLHRTILPDSPIPRLGSRFMQKFYYPNLLADSHSYCELYYFQEKPVGFISYTQNSSQLFQNWLWKKGALLAWQMSLSTLAHPSTLFAILEAIKLVSAHPQETEEQIFSEILSFGVLPEYRTLSFYQQEGIKIANELFRHAKNTLAEAGVRRFKLATNQSQDYIFPNIFYQNQGMRLLAQKHIRGFSANIYVGELPVPENENHFS